MQQTVKDPAVVNVEVARLMQLPCLRENTPVPDFMGDGEAAWLLVEHMTANGFHLRLIQQPNHWRVMYPQKKWYAEFRNDSDGGWGEYTAWGETMMEALCGAFIAARKWVTMKPTTDTNSKGGQP